LLSTIYLTSSIYFIVPERSGTDEQYSEKLRLLQDLADLREAGNLILQDRAAIKKKDKERMKLVTKEGLDIRIASMRTLKACKFCQLECFAVLS
jgi:transposase